MAATRDESTSCGKGFFTLSEVLELVTAMLNDTNVRDLKGSINASGADQIVKDGEGSSHNVGSFLQMIREINDETAFGANAKTICERLVSAMKYYISLRDRKKYDQNDIKKFCFKLTLMEANVSKLRDAMNSIESKQSDGFKEAEKQFIEASEELELEKAEVGKKTKEMIKVNKFPERVKAAKLAIEYFTNSRHNVHVESDEPPVAITPYEFWLQYLKVAKPALYEEEILRRKSRDSLFKENEAFNKKSAKFCDREVNAKVDEPVLKICESVAPAVVGLKLSDSELAELKKYRELKANKKYIPKAMKDKYSKPELDAIVV